MRKFPRFFITIALTVISCTLGNLTSVLAAPCSELSGTETIPGIGFEEIARGFDYPVHLTHAGDGSGRLFVVEQPGTIRILEEGKTRAVPFLDIRDKVESGGEKGLLSVAFHPRYKDNGFFFVDYTTSDQGKLYTIVSRFQRAGAHQADPKSERVLFKIYQPFSNHNGGPLVFGPDGFLYIGMGDGGSANDPYRNGQNKNSLLGKLLRIDVDRPQGTRPYGIPPDNPFMGQPDARPEIWAYGLRNPWRFSFDPLNGRLFLADVGQNRVEEVDVITRGENYGWNIMEGNICTPGVNAVCRPIGLTPPIFTYDHPEGFSITGGFVYRGSDVPELCGTYLLADYVTGKTWGLRYDGKRIIAQRELSAKESFSDKLKRRLSGKSDLHISSFGQDEALELYVTDHEEGRILKIVGKKP